MIIKNVNSEFPIYVNPTFEEVAELSKHTWDTLRILRVNDDLVVADGFGASHYDLIISLEPSPKKRRRLDVKDFILYRRNGLAVMHVYGQDLMVRAVTQGWWRTYFTADQIEVLKDLIREAGLAIY